MGISDKAMRGRNGFLFLNGKDSNNLLEHLQGQIEVIASARRVHQLNRKVIGQLEVPFLGIIVPEAHCLYPEELPKGMNPPAEGRPVHLVLRDMAPEYVYALDLLSTYKSAGGIVYSGRDSHWTQSAALETYRALRGRLGRSGHLEPLYEPRDDAEVGDLAMSVRAHVISAERHRLNRTAPGYDTLFASGILSHGNVTVLHNPRGQGRCLAFGTSFSTRLVPAYASDFREVVFCYGTTVDPFMVDLVRPDCVIGELPERFLHFPAVAVRGSTMLAMILGLTEQNGVARPVTKPRADVPPDLTEVVQVLKYAAAMASGDPAPALLRRIEALDADLALRLALLKPHLMEISQRPGLRLLLSGQFYNRLVIRGASTMIDNGRLGLADIPLLPNSENGMLAAIRIYIRANLPGHARQLLDRTVEHFGESTETDYYQAYLAR